MEQSKFCRHEPSVYEMWEQMRGAMADLRQQKEGTRLSPRAGATASRILVSKDVRRRPTDPTKTTAHAVQKSPLLIDTLADQGTPHRRRHP